MSRGSTAHIPLLTIVTCLGQLYWTIFCVSLDFVSLLIHHGPNFVSPITKRRLRVDFLILKSPAGSSWSRRITQCNISKVFYSLSHDSRRLLAIRLFLPTFVHTRVYYQLASAFTLPIFTSCLPVFSPYTACFICVFLSCKLLAKIFQRCRLYGGTAQLSGMCWR